MKTTLEKLNEIGSEKICPVAFFVKNGKILIGLRNYTPDKYKEVSVWTLPGGRCEKNEKVEITLRREVNEEVGINDLFIRDFLGEIAGAKEGDIVYVFKCETTQEPRLLEPEKFSEWCWVKIEDIPSNFINHEVLRLIKNNI
ncbi:MAG: NUDIX hydrolase [Candidatus Paceibacterota bacterium]